MSGGEAVPEASAWDRTAASYQRFFAPITAHAIAALLESARIGPDRRVLDLGTGPGEAAGHAAAAGAAVTAIDNSAGMIELARTRYPHVRFEQASAEHLPFPVAAFDAIICNFVIQHLAQPAVALEECARVLAPGGSLALTAWDSYAEGHRLGLLQQAMDGLRLASAPELPERPGIFGHENGAVFQRLLAEAGFRHVRITTLRFTHHFPGPEAMWDGMVEASIRSGMRLAAQTATVRQAVREAFDRLAAPYRRGGGLEIPASATLASAQAPADRP